MKRIMMILIFCIATPIMARIGCYEKDRYDNPQFVECLCDCKNNTYPTCMWCGHYHEAQNRQVIVNQAEHTSYHTHITTPPTPEQALKTLITHYKNNKLQNAHK